MKSFSEASEFIDMDEENIYNAVSWLVLQQNDTGVFNEPGKVLHKAMQVHVDLRFRTNIWHFIKEFR